MNYTIDADPRYGEFHNFKEGNCSVSISKISDEVFSLDDFRCNDKHFKGEGRKILLYALQEIKEKNKNVNKIILFAVPETDIDARDTIKMRQEKKALAKENLKKYYRELGFADTDSDDEDEMEGNIDHIISKISRREGGGRSKKTGKKRKSRGRKGKKRKTHKFLQYFF